MSKEGGTGENRDQVLHLPWPQLIRYQWRSQAAALTQQTRQEEEQKQHFSLCSWLASIVNKPGKWMEMQHNGVAAMAYWLPILVRGKAADS